VSVPASKTTPPAASALRLFRRASSFVYPETD